MSPTRDQPDWAVRLMELLERREDAAREVARSIGDLASALSSAEILARARHEEIMSTFRRRREEGREPIQSVELSEGVNVDLTPDGRKKLMRVLGYLALLAAGAIAKYVHELAAHVR